MAENDDKPDEGTDEPEERAVDSVGDVPYFDLDALDDLSDEEKAALAESAQRLAATAGRALSAVTLGPLERPCDAVQRAAMPQIAESVKGVNAITESALQPRIVPSAKRLSDLVAASEMSTAPDTRNWSGVLDGLGTSRTMKAILASSARGVQGNLLKSGLAEVLGRSTAERAAFSVASGLKVSDSVTSIVNKLMTDTGGLGLSARSDLLASVGVTAKNLPGAAPGLTAHSGIADAFTKALASHGTMDLSGFRAAIGEAGPMRRITEELFASDIGRTRSLATQQLVATSGIADLIGTDKMMTSWRQSLLSEATARSLIGTMAVPETGAALLRDIIGANVATARVVGRYAEQNRSRMLAPAFSVRPTRELRAFLAGMPVAPNVDEVTFAVRASHGVAGIAAADLLVSDGVVDDEAGELLDAEIVEPWLTGPESARSLLFGRLLALDPHVPDLLRGAWSQVEADGPAATSMASHAVQEAIDRTLRAVAPEELVLRLYRAGRLPKNSVYEKDGEWHATRTGRIAAALHERNPGETKLVAAQAKAISASVTFLTGSLQSGKHASTGTVGLVRTWLVSVEATFTQLLYQPGDG